MYIRISKLVGIGIYRTNNNNNNMNVSRAVGTSGDEICDQPCMMIS